MELIGAISETKDDYQIVEKADDIDKIFCNVTFFEQVTRLIATETRNR